MKRFKTFELLVFRLRLLIFWTEIHLQTYVLTCTGIPGNAKSTFKLNKGLGSCVISGKENRKS